MNVIKNIDTRVALTNIAESVPLGERVYVKFGATWCGPCKMLSNVISASKLECVTIVEVDIDSKFGGELVSEAGVRGVPTMIEINGLGKFTCRVQVGTMKQLDLDKFLGGK